MELDVINKAYLYASVLAAVPLILHLVQRRRMHRVVFGSVRFLLKVSHRVVRRRRLTEVLLIILRTLAVAAVVAAFARPVLYKRQQRAGAGTVAGEAAELVLIDNSYSMTAGDRLERARKAALEAIDRAAALTKVGVAEFSSTFRLCCAIGSTETEARSAVREIAPSWRGTALASALEQANRLLTQSQRQEQHRRIVLIGDFQETAWADRTDWKLAPGIVLEVRNVADGPAVDNVFIERVGVPRLVVAGGFAEGVSAKIVNTGQAPVQANVTCEIEGKRLETRVNVKGRSDAPVRFSYAFAKPGDVTGRITVDHKDALPADNVACFTVHVNPRVKVLLVNGDAAGRLVSNDGFFLQTALEPGTAGRPSPFQVREVRPQDFKPEDLTGVEGVILASVDAIPPAAEAALRKFLTDSGGGVGFLCGPRMDPDKFNAAFRQGWTIKTKDKTGAETDETAYLAPCRLWKPALPSGEEHAVITWVDSRHEIFAPFAGPRNGDFAIARFSQYFQVNDSQQAQVLARFNNGHPALLEQQVGRGRSLLLTSSADLEWNDLCLKGVYVPFVHQFSSRLCAERSGGSRNAVVGDRIAHVLPKGAGAVEVLGPDGQKRRMATISADDGERAAFQAEQPGVYEMTYKGGAASFAVTLDPVEPDLRPMDTKVLVSAVQSDPSATGGRVEGAVAVVAKSTARERVEGSQMIWLYLIAAAVVALAAEMVLATRAGAA